MARINYLRAREESLPTGGHPPVAATTIPVLDGLVYAGLYSGGAGFAVTNWAGDDGLLTGEPLEPGRFLQFPSGCHVDTRQDESLAMTMFAIGKAPAVGFSPLVFIGSTVPGGSHGAYLFAYNATTIAVSFETTGTNDGQTVAANINDWGMYAATTPADGSAKRLLNLTTGASKTSTNTTPRAITGNETMRIGASYSASASGSVDMLCALYFNRALAQPELDALAAWGRAYAADFGIEV